MMVKRDAAEPTIVTSGFAVGQRGAGVVYGSITGADGRRMASLVRVALRCRLLPALGGRDIAYAALDALAKDLLSVGRRAVLVRLDDDALAADLAEHRPVPSALTIPYVRLCCTLNRFHEATIAAVADRTTRDLTARARAEIVLDIAA